MTPWQRMTAEQRQHRRAVRRAWRAKWSAERRAAAVEYARAYKAQQPPTPAQLEAQAKAERARWLEERGIVMGAEPAEHVRQWRRSTAAERKREWDREYDRSRSKERIRLPRTEAQNQRAAKQAHERYHNRTPEEKEADRQYERERTWSRTPEERVKETRARSLAYHTRSFAQIARDKARAVEWWANAMPEQRAAAYASAKRHRASRDVEQIERDRAAKRLYHQNRSPEQRERDRAARNTLHATRRGQAHAYREIMSSLGADMTPPKGEGSTARNHRLAEQAAGYRRIMMMEVPCLVALISALPPAPPMLTTP